MPRDLPIGNGSLMINFDHEYNIRDVYYPHVGQDNQTVDRIKSRLTPELTATLRERAAAYSAKTMKDFEQFRADPRTVEQVKRAEAGLRELESKSR